MWFKRVLLGYCAASLAVTIVTASYIEDAALSKRHRSIERLSIPLLERRQQPIGNQTSSSEILQSTSGIIITSSIFAPTVTSQTSTIVQTPSSVRTTESSHVESSSSNGDVLSSSRLISTEVTTPTSSATEQQPSEIPTQSRSTSLQSELSTSAGPSTVAGITSAVPSTAEEVQSSSTLEISSSVVEPTSTTPQIVSSSEIISSSLPTSASIPAEEPGRPPPNTVTSPANDSATSSPTIESARASVSASSTQIFTPETSSIVASTPTMPTINSTPTTTLDQQQSTTVLTSPSSPISTSDPIVTSQDPVPSSLFVESSSLPQEPLTTSTPEQVPVSTSVPVLSTTEAQMSSSDETWVSTSIPQPTFVATISSAETESSVQTLITSGEFRSSLLLSTVEPNPTPTQEETSVTETSRLFPVSSILDTLTTPIAPVTQPPLSSSSEVLFSSSFDEPTPVTNTVLSSLAPSAILSSLSDVATSSAQTADPLTSVQIPSSLPLELSSSIVDISSILSSTISLGDPSRPSVTTTQADSFSALPTASSSIAPTETEPMPSENNGITSSLLDVVSTETVSQFSFTSSVVPTPLPITIESTTSIATFEESVATESIPTSVLSSDISESRMIPSLAPSETLTTSVIVSVTSSPEISADVTLLPSSLTSVLPGTQPSFSEQSSFLSMITPSALPITESQASSAVESVPSSTPFSLTLAESSSVLISTVSESQIFPSENPTSVVASSTYNIADGSIPTSESAGPGSTHSSPESSMMANPTQSGFLTFTSSGILTTTSTLATPLPSSAMSNGTQAQSSIPITSGMVTATFSTVYISSVRSSALDMSTVAFSLFSSVTEAAVNHTNIRTSSAIPATMSSKASGTQVPASESLASSTRLGVGANSTWPSSMQPSGTATIGLPGSLNSTSTITTELGITFSRSALPTGLSTGAAPRLNETQAETLQTSSIQSAANSTTAGFITSATSDSASSARSEVPSSTSTLELDEPSTTNSAGTDDSKTAVAPHAPTSTPSRTAAAGSPPPLTTSQTAGVAVGATTGLLIAVVAAIFIARRYHAAKHGKRMSTGSIYPKVAYLYDPKTGGDTGDSEALISGATGKMPPGGPSSRAAQGSPKHVQRHSTGTMPITRFTNPGNPFRESIRDPATHRYSEYARLDTARALSAAVAGYGAGPRHSSSYTKYPSDVTNPFSDHVIPSPTFAPFSPDDIRRPELKPAPHANDGRGEYSQMPVNSYAYLNTAASLYPPVSPYERPSTRGPSPDHDTRRQTLDSDPFADPFEHDLILQVDERNRTSDSVTVFAPSPNLMSPRTPRTPVGPKLPVRQPNGMASARSLLSPVAAKYMHKAQEVKIPRKSIASPVLVQVGRSPVIKPFSPPPAAPEPRGWEDIKRHSEKRFSDEQSVPAPLKFTSPVLQRKPVPALDTRMKPSLTGAGQALLVANGLPLTVDIPHMYKKSVGLDVPGVHSRPDPAHEDMSSDPVVREKRSRELRFADPALIGKEF